MRPQEAREIEIEEGEEETGLGVGKEGERERQRVRDVYYLSVNFWPSECDNGFHLSLSLSLQFLPCAFTILAFLSFQLIRLP